MQFLNALEVLCDSNPSILLSSALSRARVTVGEFVRLLDLEQVKRNPASSRGRRRLWARHRSKILRFQKKLVWHQADIQSAVCAGTMSVIPRSLKSMLTHG